MAEALTIKVTKTEVDQAIISLQKLLAAAKAAAGGVDSLAAESAVLEKKLSTMAKTNTTVSTSLLDISSKMKVVGRDMTRYITLPLTAMAAASLKFSNDLNSAMGNVQTLIPETGDRIYELRDAVLETSAATGKGFDDLTSAMYRTISVFQDGTDTVDRFNTAVRASVAGYSTAEEAVGLLSAVTRAYGDTSSEAVDRVADLAFEAVRLGDTTFPALSTAMQVATDRAVRLGVSQEELFTTMATLTGITGDASMVATQFRSAMDGLLSPTETMTQLYSQLGVASGEAMIAEYGLIDSLKIINETATASGISLRDLITRKEGVTLVSRLATQQEEDFRTKLVQVTNGVGAADQAYRDATSGINKFGFEINKTKQSIIGLATSLGDKLQPILSSLLETVNDTVEWVSKIPTGLQYVLIGVNTLLAGIGPLLIAFGALANIVHTLSLVMPLFNAQLAFAAGSVALLTGAIVVGTIAVVAITKAYLDYKRALEEQEAIDRGTERALEQTEAISTLASSYGSLEEALAGSNSESTLTAEQHELLTSQYPDLIGMLDEYNVSLDVNETRLSDVLLAMKKIKQEELAGEFIDLIPTLNDLDKEFVNLYEEISNRGNLSLVRDIQLTLDAGFVQDSFGVSSLAQLEDYKNNLESNLSEMQEDITRYTNNLNRSNLTPEGIAFNSSNLAEARAEFEDYTRYLELTEGILSKAYEDILNTPEILENRTESDTIIEQANQTGAAYKLALYNSIGSGWKLNIGDILDTSSSVEGLDLSSVGDDIAKEWEDIFFDVTDIPLSRFLPTDENGGLVYMASATNAVASYRAELETLTSNDLSILRFDENESDIYKERLEKAKSDIVNLVRTIPEEISGGLGAESGFMEDYLFDGIILPMQNTVEEYQALYQNAKFNEVFEDLNTSMNAIDATSSGSDNLEQRIETIQEVIDSLATDENFDVLDSRFIALTDSLKPLQSGYSLLKLQEEFDALDTQNITGIITDTELLDGKIESLETTIEYLIANGFSPMGDVIQELQVMLNDLQGVNPFEEMINSMNTLDDSILKLKTDLYGFNQEMGLSGEVSAVFADATGDLASDAVSGLGSALSTAANNMGQLLYNQELFAEGATVWDGARIAVRDFALSLAEAIPALMQSAGLMLIQNSNGDAGMIAAGLSMYLGAAVADVAVGYSQAAAENDTVSNLTTSAQGNAFTTFAKGSSLSALSNSVINTPHYFPMANGTGLAGEAGSEGILPLARTSSGDLGVQSVGGGGVSVNINNYTTSDVKATSTTNDDGTQNIVVTVKNIMKNAHASGEMDKVMSSRYGTSARGA